MKRLTKVIVLIGLALFLANASFAQRVKTDYDRAANFSQYKTYSWEKVQTPDPLWVDRIKAAVDAALAAKGWTQVESNGDISIVAIEINRDQRTLNTFYDNFGGGFGRRGFGGFGGFGEATTTPETYTVGTLVVDLFDAKTKTWSGEACQAACFPTSPTRTSRTWTGECRSCFSTSLLMRSRTLEVQNDPPLQHFTQPGPFHR
jgi:Domain of unknown function (DUF4136)